MDLAFRHYLVINRWQKPFLVESTTKSKRIPYTRYALNMQGKLGLGFHFFANGHPSLASEGWPLEAGWLA
jgi:hypothetical protein